MAERDDDLSLGVVPYGVVYLIDPAVSLREKQRDLGNIRKLGFNTVVLWPAVSRWDGTPSGETAFDSIDEGMDICAELGLKAILELQGQNRGNQEAPERFRLSEGVADINHPEYRRMTVRYLKEVAAHFKGHPALLAYDVYNEVSHSSRDPWTLREFVAFLKRQYDEDIQALNRAWGTYFTDFDAIADEPPELHDEYVLWLSVLPKRDWLRFRPRNFADRLDEWCAAIREVDPDTVTLADVLGCDTMQNRAHEECFGVTDWSIAEHVDVLGLSCWGQFLGPGWKRRDAFRWPQYWRTALSAARGKQVIISELMTQNQAMFPDDDSSLTDQIRLWSYQAVFNGIKGLVYWKYRPFRRGIQVAGRGLTDLAGEPNDHGRQAAEVAAFVSRHVEKLGNARPDDSGCAILHDHNAQDIYQSIQPRWGDFYTDAHGGMFRGFWSHGVSPGYLLPQDIVHGVPERVRVLAVPCNVSVSQGTADALAAFVRRGGVLLTEGRFALLNEDAILWPHVPGGGLCNVFGVEEGAFTACFTDTVSVEDATLELSDDYFQELKLTDDVAVALKTAGGRPLVVSRSVGQGTYIHVPFLLSHKLHAEESGAPEVFDMIFAMLEPALTPAVPVSDKGPLVDVSVLLMKDGKPLLVGVTNFEQHPSTVRLQWREQPMSIEGDEHAAVERRGQELLVTVSARRAAAVFL